MVALWLLTNWAVGEWWSRPASPGRGWPPLGYHGDHRGGDGKMVRRQEEGPQGLRSFSELGLNVSGLSL